jgi:hypothetical protein
MPTNTADTPARPDAGDAPIPADAGLKPGRAEEREPRTGSELLTAAALGEGLTPAEHDDMVAFYLSNEGLPGDDEITDLTVKLGHGSKARTFACSVHPIEWSEWQDARERATNEKAGRFDAFVSASWIVARALVTPKLGPTVARLQAEDPGKAPEDAAQLLRRMFRKQSGALLELSGKVLEISKLQEENESVKEIEAAKN